MSPLHTTVPIAALSIMSFASNPDSLNVPTLAVDLNDVNRRLSQSQPQRATSSLALYFDACVEWAPPYQDPALNPPTPPPEPAINSVQVANAKTPSYGDVPAVFHAPRRSQTPPQQRTSPLSLPSRIHLSPSIPLLPPHPPSKRKRCDSETTDTHPESTIQHRHIIRKQRRISDSAKEALSVAALRPASGGEVAMEAGHEAKVKEVEIDGTTMHAQIGALVSGDAAEEDVLRDDSIGELVARDDAVEELVARDKLALGTGDGALPVKEGTVSKAL